MGTQEGDEVIELRQFSAPDVTVGVWLGDL